MQNDTNTPGSSSTAAHTPPPLETPEKTSGWRSVLSTIAILLIAPLIAILLTAYVFQSYQVDGPSMETTLQNDDRLIVWKLPRTLARITGNDYVPSRGDIVIFNEEDTSGFSSGRSKQLIKRVIALPGEKISIVDGNLIVYNSEHPEGFQPDLQFKHGHSIGTTEPESEATSWTLKDNEVFVAGDNRVDSLDSRAFGPVPVDDIVGKLAFRILPLNNAMRF